MIIGLTGKYCSGKNYISSLLEARGLAVLDVDKLGYKALEDEKEAVFAKFGNDLRQEDGSVNRRLLGQRVFGNAEKLSDLEEIVHPAVNSLTEEWISGMGSEPKEGQSQGSQANCVINAALLHKSSVFKRLDGIILVKAPFFTRLIRAKQRDRLSFAQIIKRFSSQRDFNSQYLASNAEIYIVENPGIGKYKGVHEKCPNKDNTSKLERKLDTILKGIK